MDLTTCIAVGAIVLCVLALFAVRRMPNEIPLTCDTVEVTIEQNLTPRPESKVYEVVYPLTSSPPFFLPEIPHIEGGPKVTNVLISHEFPMLPIIFKDCWVTPGTRIKVTIYRDAFDEVAKIERA